MRGSGPGACSHGRGYHGSAPRRLRMAVLPTDVLLALPEKLNSLQMYSDGGHGLEDGLVTHFSGHCILLALGPIGAQTVAHKCGDQAH